LNTETIGTESESGGRPISASAGSGVMGQMLPIVFAVVATLLFWILVASFTDEGGFVRALFLPGEGFFEKAIPLAIMFLFFWCLCDLVLKLRSISGQQRSLSHEALGSCPSLVGNDDIDGAIRGLNRAPGSDRAGYVFRTVSALLEHLRSTSDPQRSHEFFRHRFDLDTESTASSYTVVRVFIWAMPILGFIGTVVGISLAVGDFSGFLSGDIDDLELVKRELANVSVGLSFAFNTTLLGLVTSLFAMLLTTYVQRREELLARGVEDLCLRVIAVARHDRPATVTGVGGVDSGQLLEAMQAFAEMVGAESERLRGGFETFNARFLEVGNRISEAYAGLGAALEEQASESAGRMQESVSQLTGALSDASSAFYESTTALSRELESFAPDLGGMKKAIVEGLDRVDAYHSQFEEILRANTQEVVAAQEKLGARITEGMERMDLSNTQFEEALRANAQQVFASHEKLGTVLAEGIDRVNQSNTQFGEALLSNTQQVIESQEKLGEKVGGALLSNAQQLVESQEKMGEKVEDILRSNARQVVESQEMLGEKVGGALLSNAQQLVESQEKMGAKVEEILRSNAQQVVESQEKLGEKVEAIRPTQDMMARVSQSVEDTNGALQQVRELHQALLPVLETLSQPMELRMVPVVRKSGGDGEQG